MRKTVNILGLALVIANLLGCNSNTPKNTSQNQPFLFEEVTVTEMHQGYQKGDFTAEEVVQAYLNRIEAIDKKGPTLNSIIQVNPDALQIAKQLDFELKAGKPIGPLFGIPVLIKDNIRFNSDMAYTPIFNNRKHFNP